MKTYSTPRLEAKGSLVTQTHGVMVGTHDPDGNSELASVGTVGFGL